MRSLMALSLLLSSTAGVMSAEIKASSRIDTVTVYPASAEVTRTARNQQRRRASTSSCSPTCRRRPCPARSASRARPPPSSRSARVDTRRVSVPRTDDAVTATERKRIEDAIEKLRDEKAVLQAGIDAAEAQKRLINNLAQLPAQPLPPSATAAQQPELVAAVRPDRPAQRRGAEGHPRSADQGPRGGPADRRSDRQAPVPGTRPGGAHRGEGVRHRRRPVDADLTIRYQVRSASRTPFYDARLSTGTKAQPPKLQLVRRASNPAEVRRPGTTCCSPCRRRGLEPAARRRS